MSLFSIPYRFHLVQFLMDIVVYLYVVYNDEGVV